MTNEIIPSLCIVPVIGMHPDGGCGPFLGTGSFVGEQRRLITCEHVLAQWDGNYGISTHEDNPQLYPAMPIRRDTETDLACLEVKGYEPPNFIPLEHDDEIILNQLICSFEYGTTVVAGNHINFSPANRMGNVTRVLDLTEHYSTAGDRMLELSFPALKGASGAPVFNWLPPFNLWGILSQNIARELHPARVETILDEEGNVTDETRFYLPQGLAINVIHIRELLQEIET